MKVNGKTQIPNIVVYVALYAILFGVGIWVLIADRESPTNWLVYVGMIVSISAGVIKFAVHSWKRQRTAA
jgi:disulfide bond formation protein DsbB